MYRPAIKCNFDSILYVLFMLESNHKMVNLTQNEICAVRCSKMQLNNMMGRKSLCEILHIAGLLKSNANTTEKFIKHLLPAKVREINLLKNTNHKTRKRQEWGGGGLRKNFLCQRDQERDINYTTINKYGINKRRHLEFKIQNSN